MKRKTIGTLVATTLLMAGVATGAVAAEADSSTLLQTEAQRTDALGARYGQTAVEMRIASQFNAFAGSNENAHNLVTGLRSGTPITLNTAPASGGGTTSTASATIEPGTRPMGYGNVFISLALAQQQLTRYGITDPTPQEIQAALTGGTITSAAGQSVTLQGVLTQRASGQGWGVIARSQDTNLGRVVSALKGVNQQVAVRATTTQEAGAATMARPAPAPVVTGLQGSAASDVATGGHGKGGFNGNANGIVNAGGEGGSVNAGLGAGAHAQGAGGIVTGAGVGASSRGIVSPGLGRGHVKP